MVDFVNNFAFFPFIFVVDDEGDDGGMGSTLDNQTSDDMLSPLQKLQKYVDNDNTFNR